MDGQNILCRSKKNPANSSPDQTKRLLRKKVFIMDDTWLEALKFLTCFQWSQKRFVSPQINGIVVRNISRLPKMVLDSATMYYIYDSRQELTEELKKLSLDKDTIVAFDTIMQEEQSTQWFKSRGFTINAPVNITTENAIINVNTWNREWKSNVNVCILGTAQDHIQLSTQEKRFPWFRTRPYDMWDRKPVLFYAQFHPIMNQYWNYLAHFLKCIFHPTSYVKDIKMYAVNQKFIDSLKCNVGSVDNENRYIRCKSFCLDEIWNVGDTNIVHLSDFLKWLERNVRAESIRTFYIKGNEAYVLVANFLLDSAEAKQCASKEMHIWASDSVAFLNILIKKFHTIPFVKSAIPIIEFSGYPRQEEHRAHLGPNLIDQEDNSQASNEYDAVYSMYMVSNGVNQMQISFYHGYCYSSFDRCSVSIYSI